MKTNHYKIFLAGSTKLDSERQIIKAVVSEYNATVSLHNGSIADLYQVYTYENFDSVIDSNTGQTAYNLFIKNESDLAVFVLSGQIGEKTLKEFDVAYESLKSNRKAPALFVLSNNADNNEEVVRIRKCLEANGEYYSKYNDVDELKQKMRDMLSKFSARKKQEKNQKIKKVFGGSFVILLIVGLMFGLWGIKKVEYNNAIKKAEQALEYYQQHPKTLPAYNKLKDALDLLEKNGVGSEEPVKQKIERQLKNM